MIDTLPQLSTQNSWLVGCVGGPQGFGALCARCCGMSNGITASCQHLPNLKASIAKASKETDLQEDIEGAVQESEWKT